MRILQRKASTGISAAGVSDNVRRRKLQCAYERGRVSDDRSHRIILVARRIAGESLADFVERNDLEFLRERHEIQVPGVGAWRGISTSEVAAVDEHDWMPRPGDVV